MKKIIILITLTISLIGCNSIPSNDITMGNWVVDGKVYQYSGRMGDKVMLSDFLQKYGNEYKIVAFSSITDTIVCEKIK